MQASAAIIHYELGGGEGGGGVTRVKVCVCGGQLECNTVLNEAFSNRSCLPGKIISRCNKPQ